MSTQGIVLRGGTGESYFSRTNDNPVYINRNTSDGDLVSFRKDGTTVGSIGSRSGVVSYIVLDPRTSVKGAALLGGSIDANEGIINPGKNDGDIADAAISFGTSSSRFKDLYLSGIAKVGSGSFDGGGVQHNYGSDANSRSWWAKTDTHGYGDFALRQSTTKTGSTYETKLLINASGNVGIGESSPSVPLHIKGSGTYIAGIESTSAYAYLGLRDSNSGGCTSFSFYHSTNFN